MLPCRRRRPLLRRLGCCCVNKEWIMDKELLLLLSSCETAGAGGSRAELLLERCRNNIVSWSLLFVELNASSWSSSSE